MWKNWIFSRRIIGKNINDFCVKAEDLHASDSINILTLLQSINQQSTNQCELKTKETKLFHARWVATRIPASLSSPFSHSLVCVYFLSETNYSKIIDEINKIKRKNRISLEDTRFSLGKMLNFLIIILTAIGGSLPDIVSKIISLFANSPL